METVHKFPQAFSVTPNLLDYDDECARFTWDSARKWLDGLPDGRGLNIAHEAVDRHARGPRSAQTALRWLGKEGATLDLSYGQLSELTSRFANALADLGVNAGDHVFTLLGRLPALYIALLGTLKHRCVVTPLFSAFGPQPIATRMNLGQAKVLVTTSSLYRRKIEAMRAQMSSLQHVILLVDDEPANLPPATLEWQTLLATSSARYEIGPTDSQSPALLHFTSGTTGTPKGALHVHEAVVGHHATGRYALDLHEGDIFWCTADPGWVTGTSYGIIAPLTHGLTLVVDEAEFDALRWYTILERERVSVWYTAPTAVRMMMKAGAGAAREHRFADLRFIASVGEPLNPQAVTWGIEAFGLPIHDNWWQTETGGIMIANYQAMEIRPGSMGRPLPGVIAAIVRHEADGSVTPVGDPNVEGELALRRGWPSMFRGYLGEPARYAKCFAGDWYLTGDLARKDADGYYWFVGRADDMIKSSGHLIGPFEVESALMEHPAVLEAGVIGKPEPLIGEVVKAFVALKPGVIASAALERELLGFARTRLGAAVAPKEIAFATTLPKTRSGKIMRRLLRARELGLPEGDISALESS